VSLCIQRPVFGMLYPIVYAHSFVPIEFDAQLGSFYWTSYYGVHDYIKRNMEYKLIQVCRADRGFLFSGHFSRRELISAWVMIGGLALYKWICRSSLYKASYLLVLTRYQGKVRYLVQTFAR